MKIADIETGENIDLKPESEITDDPQLAQGLKDVQELLIDNANHSEKGNDSNDEHSSDEVEIGGEGDAANQQPNSPPPITTKQSEETQKEMAKFLVEEGDELQANGFEVAYWWLNKKHHDAAKADLEMLMDKVALGIALSPAEQKLLTYARDFIKKYEANKSDFEANLRLSNERRALAVDALQVYLKSQNVELPPWLALAGIIGRQLLANSVSVATSSNPYNPPT